MIRFFVCKDVSTLILNKINEIQNTLLNMDDHTLKPSFMYSYSIFESTLTEILRYYLMAFPEKLDNNLTIGKDELLSTSSTHDIILFSVNKHIRKYSCKTLLEYLSFFKHILSIEFFIDDNMIKKISQIRNSMTHDDANSELLCFHINQFDLSLSYSDIKSYISYLCDLLNDMLNQINEVYNKYTYEFLLRSIWKYTFSTPLLNFDDIWEFNQDGVLQIRDLKKVKKKISGISSSEHLFLSIFLQQYNNSLNDALHSFHNIPALVSMDSDSKDKLINIITFFKYYPLFFNGTPIR